MEITDINYESKNDSKLKYPNSPSVSDWERDRYWHQGISSLDLQ